MRGSIVGLVVIAIIALMLIYTYRPDLLELLMDALAALHPLTGDLRQARNPRLGSYTAQRNMTTWEGRVPFWH